MSKDKVKETEKVLYKHFNELQEVLAIGGGMEIHPARKLTKEHYTVLLDMIGTMGKRAVEDTVVQPPTKPEIMHGVIALEHLQKLWEIKRERDERYNTERTKKEFHQKSKRKDKTG